MGKKFDLVLFTDDSVLDWQQGLFSRDYWILQLLITDSLIRRVLVIDKVAPTRPRNLQNFISNWSLPETDSLKIVRRRAFDLLTKQTFKLDTGGSRQLVNYRTSFWGLNTNWGQQQLGKLMAELGFENILFWSGSVSSFALGQKSKVSFSKKVVDLSECFNPAQFQSGSQSADLLVSRQPWSEHLGLERGCGKFKRLPTPVFANKKCDLNQLEIPSRCRIDSSRPIVGYLGSWQEKYFDLDLFRQIAEANMHLNFFLAGEVDNKVSRVVKQSVLKLPNVFLQTGLIPAEDLKYYYAQFVIGLSLGSLGFGGGLDLNLMAQFLAAGVPVVSTSQLGVEEFESGVWVVDHPLGFSHAFDQIIKLKQAGLLKVELPFSYQSKFCLKDLGW